MLFAVDDGPDATLVAAAGAHDHAAGLERDRVDDLGLFNVEPDRVVDADDRVGVADGPAVVGDEEGDALGAELDALDLAELVRRLVGRDAMDREAALWVVQDPEVLIRLFNRHDVCPRPVSHRFFPGADGTDP